MGRLAQQTYNGAKQAFARLVELCGGQRQVLELELTRGSQTDLSRWASRNSEHALRMPPIDVVIDLEEAAGEPVVTRFLADRANCLLVPLPEGGAADAIDEHIIRSAKDYADMVAAIIDAKRDGKITAEEAPRLLTTIRDLMIELAAAAEAIKAVAK